MKLHSAVWILPFVFAAGASAQGHEARDARTQEPEAAPADGAEMELAQRRAAAALLQAALAAPAQDGPQRLASLKGAALRAARELPGRRVAGLLRAALEDARWQAILDVDGAGKNLEARLADLASDLCFEPRMEAPLPKGFPGPTAVHELEIKRYPRYRLAQTSMQDGRQNGAFWRLFGHIQQNEIPMTSPVETTLVDQGGRLVETRMAFLYEGPEQGPASAQNEAVSVETIDPMTVLSLGCRGNDSRARLAEAHALLLAWLEQNPGWRPAGDLRVFGYNSPMVRGDQRTFEVQLPIEAQPQLP